MEQKESKADSFLLLAIIIFLVSCVIYYYSIMIAYYQLYFWLKEGQYIDTSLYSCFTPNKWTGIGPLSYIPVTWTKTSLSQWLLNPADWVGLHKIIVYIFKSISIYVVGFFIGFLLTMTHTALIE
ncbi:hypothetical protein SC123_10035 [Legionella pneumophila serogroup 1]|uniref:hypothetical protein n=1 Tax=Legionella pneumophila TaxID=446 RepID=UPI00197CF296|nr:hypothetical protein [Legionella pneumophila]MBN5929496.1 hypothetical protein [Legionella pneumophila]